MLFRSKTSKRRYRPNNFTNRRKQKGKTAYVYVFTLGIEGQYKILYSKNCVQRLASLRSSNPNVQEVISCQVSRAWEHEQKLHYHFRRKRVEREIYKLSLSDLNYIRTYLLEKQDKDRANGEQASPEEAAIK